MKIFSFIRQASFAKFIMADIVYALKRLGWDVKWEDLEQFVDQNKSRPQEERQKAVSHLIEEIEAYDPDLVFSYGLEYCANPFKEILPQSSQPFYEVLKKPAVFFLFDFGYPFDSSTMDAYKEKLFTDLQKPEYLFFCWDRWAIKRMKAFGLSKTFYMPMAVNEELFYKYEGPQECRHRSEANVLFVGGPTEERIKHLETIADLGLKVYGYGREHWEKSGLKVCYGGEIYEREALRDCYNSSKISVNITRAHGPTSLNMRVYEAMACGSLMLTDDTSDAVNLFQADEEIVVYSSLKDLREKTSKMISEKGQRKRIAEAGRTKVLQEHTYYERLKINLPVVIQFIKEITIFNRLSRLAEKNPQQALDLSAYKDTESLILYNRDNYYYQKAFFQNTIGAFGEAVKDLDLALEANRFHLAARQLKASIEGRAK